MIQPYQAVLLGSIPKYCNQASKSPPYPLHALSIGQTPAQVDTWVVLQLTAPVVRISVKSAGPNLQSMRLINYIKLIPLE